MLIESALQNGFSGHRFGRAVRKALTAGTGTPASAIELLGSPLSLARNTEIYGENDRADRLYKVISGTVRTCKALIDGRRQIGSFYLAGDVFGLETGNEHTFSAEAVVDAEMLVIKRADVVSLAEWDKDVTRQLWILLGRELQRAQDHVLLLAKTAQERVAGFLLEMAERIESSDDEVELPMSRQDIADYLGLTIETVSRMLTQFENRSAIALPTSKRIVLRNRAALKRLNA
jgi:CRP/FNR family transcriptional regulator, nitrogen fixation regulation protein